MAGGDTMPTAQTSAADRSRLIEFLRQQAAQDDLAAYDEEVFAHAAHFAANALSRHIPGASIIAIDDDEMLQLNSRRLSAITVINDNMPFLIDTILGEVVDSSGDYLKTVFDDHLSTYNPSFSEGGLARVHFIIGRTGGRTPDVTRAELEKAFVPSPHMGGYSV